MVDCLSARNNRLKVRQLQRALYLKSKQDAFYQFYSLYDKLYRSDILWEAWRQVKQNKGSAGIDGMTIEEIIAERKETEIINQLQIMLREKRYSFSPIRRVYIPKLIGKRPLGISIIKDRIIQTAMKIILEPIFEAMFQDCSHGYRPKRDAKQASKAVRADLYKHAKWVVKVDLQSYFDNISHKKLIKLIATRVRDGSMLKLIKQTLKIPVREEGKTMVIKRGVPQGSPISPLYSNIYLDVLDRIWQQRNYTEKLRARLHRYADDILLVCYGNPQAALAQLKAIVTQLEITLHPEKTRITTLTEGFNFLGYHFVMRKSPTSGKQITYTFPTKESQKNIRQRLRKLMSRKAPVKPHEMLEEIKPVVLGWVNYYRHTNASEAFRKLQNYINIRFRRYLIHRSKGRGFGWRNYPSSKLYEMGMIHISSGLLQY